MPRSTRKKSTTAGGQTLTSEKLDWIDNWLQRMLMEFPSKGDLETVEIQDWHKDLAPYTLEAIEFAFDTHRRNGNFFPIQADILPLCESMDPRRNVVANTSSCDAICKARHGKGYGWNDMIWLFKKAQSVHASGDTPDYDALLDELDKKRPEGAPEFRREA